VRSERRNKLPVVALCVLLVAACLWGSRDAAAAPEYGYTFDQYGQKVPSPIGYVRERVIGAVELGIGQLRNPQHVRVDDDGYIYIADTGNNRILKVSPELKVVLTLDSAAGLRLREPYGFFVEEDGNILVADTGNQRLVRFSPEGAVLDVYERPESSVLPQNFYYQPVKVVTDPSGFIYVINRGDYRGLIRLDRSGRFRGYFAPIHVGFDLRRWLERMILTKEQLEQMATNLPPSHSGMTITSEGFIYTTVAHASSGQIKRHNAVGENTYPDKVYGEVSTSWRWRIPSFVDLAVSEIGIISALEANTGNIYQYDSEGNLLLVFGGLGQNGWFQSPVSVALDRNDRLYVLDSQRADIQVFRPTEFTTLIHQATKLYSEGNYEAASGPWEQVLAMNSNYARAHHALGKIAMKREAYEEALNHYLHSGDRDAYGEAFAAYRSYKSLHEFGTVLFYMALGITAVIGAWKGMKALVQRASPESGILLRTLRAAVRIIREPGEIFLELKQPRYFVPGLIMLGAVFAVRVASLMLTSFHYSSIDPTRTNLLIEALYVYVPLLTWVVAHYAVSTISGGKGYVRQYLVGTAFSLSPYVLFAIPLALLTNVMTPGERVYYIVANQVIVVLCVLLFIHQVRVMNEYGYKKAIGIGLISLFVVLLMWGAAAVVYGLSVEMVRFVREIILEMTLR